MVPNLANLISQAILLVDGLGHIVELNKAACTLLAYEDGRLTGLCADDLIAANDRTRFSELRQRVSSQSSGPVDEDFAIMTNDGREIPVNLRLARTDNEADSRLLIEISDLTQQRDLETRLAESEDRFNALTEFSLDWYWKQDEDLRFTYFSGGHKSTHLTDAEKGIGKTRFELPCVFVSEQARTEHARVLAERKPFRNLLLHYPDNDRWALVSGNPIFSPDGVFRGYHGIALDLTSQKRAERALRESESRFRALSAMSSDWYWEQDADLRFTKLDSVTVQTPLNAIENVQGKKRTELPYVWHSPEERAAHEKTLAQRKPFRDLLLHNPANGRYALTSGDPVFGENGEFRGYHGVSRDVTTEIESERALKESEARFRALTAMSSDWFWEQDENLRYTYMSPSGRRNAKVPVDRIIGHTRFELPLTWESEAAKKEHMRMLEARLPFRDLLLRTISDDQYAYISGEPIFDEDGQFRGYRGVTIDVTEQKQAEAEAVHFATHDALTGLPNRTLLVDRMQHAIARAERASKRVAVMFMDIDRFKLLNDSFGHSAGDAFLQTISARLNGVLRQSDTVARFAGDEFVVMLEDLDDDSFATTIADKIQSALSEDVELDGIHFQTTVSIGISLYPRDGKDTETLLRHADLAMYEAKEAGRGRVRVFSEEMSWRAAMRTTLDRQLKRAVENQEFELFFHPQHRVSDGEFVGAEVLLRWNHPERGVVEPPEFIAAAEESGLIVSIGQFVLENTFEMMSRWLSAGSAPPRIAANISSRQLENGPDLVANLQKLLDSYKVPPELIELEITESLLIPKQEEDRYAVLEALGKMGLRVAIDDFGTGYSSLNYLKQLPVNAIKIDRAFIEDITYNRENTAIVRSVIGLARHLKMEVISEGVETEEQLKVLQHLGCDTYQGFLRAEPMQQHVFERDFLGMHGKKTARPVSPKQAVSR
ncbi:MAG: EAL domain-containing protein [Betaproteobacteria bacterium]|nr:MAG: EAL domain-containing protein [Betaproteobacteria bacterium]